jgi:hypothetical protein
MAQGRTKADIAARLHLSESSIEQYATSIFAKLGLSDEPRVHRRVAAVLTFLRDAGRAEPLQAASTPHAPAARDRRGGGGLDGRRHRR